MEETTVQRIGYPVPVDVRSGQDFPQRLPGGVPG